STHVLSEVEATCSRAIIISRGRVVGQGSISALKTPLKNQLVRLVVRRAKSAASSLSPNSIIETLGPIAKARGFTLTVLEQNSVLETLEVHLGELPDIAPLIEACVEHRLDVLEASPQRAALDEAFAELTELAEPAEFTEQNEQTEQGEKEAV